jgi:hypothetical protein
MEMKHLWLKFSCAYNNIAFWDGGYACATATRLATCAGASHAYSPGSRLRCNTIIRIHNWVYQGTKHRRKENASDEISTVLCDAEPGTRN